MAGHPKKPDEPARSRKNWTDAELQYLSDKYGLVKLETLARNLQRNPRAVYEATKKRLHRQRIYDNFYNARELARLLGIGDAKTIVWWCDKGWLKGRRGVYFQGTYRAWRFSEKNVVLCLKDRPWLVNINKMDEHLFRAVVKAEWERDPWFRPSDVAPMIGVATADAVHKYIYLGWIPAEKKPGGPWQGMWIIRRSAVDAFLANDPRPGHKRLASSLSRKNMLRTQGRPLQLGRLWEIVCPSCGLTVRIMAPPKMFGPTVRKMFIEQHVNGGCQHGAICRVKEVIKNGCQGNREVRPDIQGGADRLTTSDTNL